MKNPPFQLSQNLTINDLSDEILRIIAECLSSPLRHDGMDCNGLHDPKSLLELSLCSHRFHQITEPVLYNLFYEKDQYPREKIKDLRKFLCRILARPDLARQTRSYHGRARKFEPDHDGHDNSLDISAITEEEWTRIKTAARAATASDTEYEAWVLDIENGSWEAITAMALSSLPNLQEIEFHSWGLGSNSNIERLMERAASLQNRSETSPFAMDNLRKVSLSYWDTEGGLDIGECLPFCKIKSVRSFSSRMMAGEDYYDTDQVVFDESDKPEYFNSWPMFNNVTELSLQQSAIDHQSLVFLLRCFPNLERFDYEHGGACVGYAAFEPPRLLQALEHLKPCLRELSIFDMDRQHDDDYSRYAIGSLHGFEKLKLIHMDSIILLGANDDGDGADETNFKRQQALTEALPESIETLKLRNCNDNLYEGKSELVEPLSELISNKQSFPALKCIDIEWSTVIYPDKPSPPSPNSFPGFTREEAFEFLAEAEAVGVEMVVGAMEPPA